MSTDTLHQPLSTVVQLKLEDVRKIEQKSKNLVFGYVRNVQRSFPTNIVYYTIPTLITHWILLYYYIWEKIDEDNCAPEYALSKDNRVITLQQNWSSGAVYFKKVLKSGIHRWKFRILYVNDEHYWMTIGVFKTKTDKSRVSACRVDNFSEEYGYGWLVNYQQISARWSRYGHRDCKAGDIIQMILNLNDWTLRYILNGKDLGVAWNNIEKTTYKAVVSANNKDDSIEFVSYEKLD